MGDAIDGYRKIQGAIFRWLIFVIVLVVATSIEAVHQQISFCFGESFYFYLKLSPWGAFGALMHSAFLSAKDKNGLEKERAKAEAGGRVATHLPPDIFDVRMYTIYILSGFLMAVLSAFLLRAGITYIDEGIDEVLAMKTKFPLFALFAFYAGYSQYGFIGKIRKSADSV